MKLSKIKVFIACISVAFASFLCSQSAFAIDISESGTLGKKALYAGVLSCYEELVSPIALKNFDGSYNGLLKNGSEDRSETVPWFGFAYDETGYRIGFSCRTVMTGKVSKPISSSITADTTEKTKRLTDIYYIKTSGSEEANEDLCYQFGLKYDKYVDKEYVSTSTGYTQPLCIKKENGVNKTYEGSAAGATTGIVSFSGLGKDTLTIKVDTGGAGWHKESDSLGGIFNGEESQIFAEVGKIISDLGGFTSPGKITRSDTEYYGEQSVTGYQASRDIEYVYYMACGNYSFYADNGGVQCTDGNGDISSEFSVRFKNNSVSDAEYRKNELVGADGIINKFSGGLDKSKILFTMDEEYELYQYYLTNLYGVSNISCYSEEMHDNSLRRTRLWWDEMNKYSRFCYFQVPSENEKRYVWGVGDDKLFGVAMTFDEMLARMDALTNTSQPSSAIDDDHDPGYTPDPSDSSSCYNAGGLNGMGWVICPTLYNLRDAAIGISGAIDNMLEVDVDFYKTGSETYRIWGYMRSIANTFLAIILVAVIFSQITGYGIDNYGIKKLLPKFVVMIILINLSFILCQLAIDASNILGNGLNNMFQAMASYNPWNLGEGISKVAAGIIALVTGAAAESTLIISAVMIFTSEFNVAIIIVFILALLAIVIGVLIFFLMLGARSIIIILFTAISPIALACYILPNTQKWFKNWWNVFKTALIMYPICGAVYGLSWVIRAMVFPQHGSQVGIHPVMAIVAVLTPVLPYYMMPTLVKGALSGLGAVGQFFNSIGNGLRKGISEGSRAMQNTGAYKSGTETARRNMTRVQAGLRKDGTINPKVSKFGKVLRGGNKGMAAARQQYISDRNKAAREDALMDESGVGFLAAKINQEKMASADVVKDYATYLKDVTNNGADEDTLFEKFEEYVKAGKKEGALAVVQIAGRRKDTAASFMKKFISGRDLSGTDAARFDRMKGHYEGAAKDVFRSINKEIAEGENSKIFRSTAPTDFEYSSSVNKISKGEDLPEYLSSYNNWVGGDANWNENAGLAGAAHIADAIDHGITNPSELVGASAGSLGDLQKWVEATGNWANMSDEQISTYSVEDQKLIKKIKDQRNKLVSLAASTVANKDKPDAAWDTTVGKVNAISSIASLKPKEPQKPSGEMVPGQEIEIVRENPPKERYIQDPKTGKNRRVDNGSGIA